MDVGLLELSHNSKTHLAIKENEKQVKFHIGDSSPDAHPSWEQSALEAICPGESPAHSFLATRSSKGFSLQSSL